MKTLTITRREGPDLNVLLDDSDYENVKHLSWHLQNGYAATIFNVDGVKSYAYLHRYLLEDQILTYQTETSSASHPEGKRARIVFRDKNKLNCQRSNMVIQRPKVKVPKPKTSRYRGVCYDKKILKWRAKVTFNREIVFEKSFVSEEEAYSAVTEKYQEINAAIDTGELEGRGFKVQAWKGLTDPQDKVLLRPEPKDLTEILAEHGEELVKRLEVSPMRLGLPTDRRNKKIVVAVRQGEKGLVPKFIRFKLGKKNLRLKLDVREDYDEVVLDPANSTSDMIWFEK